MEQIDMEQITSGRLVERKGAGRQRTLFVEVGQRIGRGVVIEAEIRIPVTRPGRDRSVRAARLICDCGNEYVAQIQRLVGADYGTKSCGCLSRERLAAGRRKGPEAVRGTRAHNFVDRMGQRYGRLVVIAPAETLVMRGKRSARWLCRCDCGNEIVLRAGSLGRGLTKSCGCMQHGPKLPPGVGARNRVLKTYKGSARRRGHAWELGDDDFDRLVSQNCHYCGIAPSSLSVYGLSQFTYNGLDRVDNDLGYTRRNVVTCCAICNNAKKDLSYDEFMAWIARLTEFHWFHPDLLPSRLLREVI